ncbi:phytase [Acinetobacter qingfengensis]|uniref:3-phytase n=2 Tax=Acinetobacter qingfengensis TaxID=1262585 RepID=A0A1E7R556_9GAMM|nr:phytase [Acinetobacter qingfengensis]OEY94499.1 3-phytase [Acinetobacter qingfengensis]
MTACATQQQVTQTAAKVSTSETIAVKQLAQDEFKLENAKAINWSAWPEAVLLQTSKTQGLRILNAQQHILFQQNGHFSSFDSRANAQGILLAVSDIQRQQVLLAQLDQTQKALQTTTYIPKRHFKVEDVCLYQDQQQNTFAFLVGEEGMGEQWFVAKQQQPLKQPLLVRTLSLPPQSSFCQVDDSTAQLIVNEANVGVWAYPAGTEAELTRQPIDLIKPFGSIQGSPSGLALINQQLAVLDEKASLIYRYQYLDQAWKTLTPLKLEGALQEPEQLSFSGTDDSKKLWIYDEERILTGQVNWQTKPMAKTTELPVVVADIQTQSVPSAGDAADDPAIWHNKNAPDQSRILGTDKQGGLQVYDLHGQTKQYLKVGRLNNVDIRPNFKWGKQQVDLAVATNRDHNSLHLFAIHQQTGQVSEIGQVKTSLKDIYGLCLYQDPKGEIYAIPNDQDGRFIQYHLYANGDHIEAKVIQQFAVKTQPEGCVVDDASGRIFLGEEDHAVWVKDLTSSTQAMQKVIEVGQVVHDDIEGLALYHGQNKSYLIISSQGNDSYVVVDAQAPYTVRGAFRIGLNAEQKIDAVSETDGLDVSSHYFGSKWSKGLLVVQDGRKRMPEANQNFKYVSWEKIAELLKLE